MGRETRLKTIVFISAVLIIGLLSCNALAAGKTRAAGIFESVEEDNGIVISGKGYSLSSSARIEDHKGNRITLRGLPLGSKVEFEYEYTRDGFVVIYMREIPQ